MPSFADDLRRYGPDGSSAPSREEALAYCADLTDRHYENFSVVTHLTPPHLIPAFRAVYAFCRWSDDLGDEVGDPARATDLLAWWRGELRALYRGSARHPVMIALAETVEEYQIPIAPFEALISAFEQDQVVGQLERALTQRVTIERAVGMVMAWYGDDAVAAFHRLRTAARSRRVTVRSLAEALVHDWPAA